MKQNDVMKLDYVELTITREDIDLLVDRHSIVMVDDGSFRIVRDGSDSAVDCMVAKADLLRGQLELESYTYYRKVQIGTSQDAAHPKWYEVVSVTRLTEPQHMADSTRSALYAVRGNMEYVVHKIDEILGDTK